MLGSEWDVGIQAVPVPSIPSSPIPIIPIDPMSTRHTETGKKASLTDPTASV